MHYIKIELYIYIKHFRKWNGGNTFELCNYPWKEMPAERTKLILLGNASLFNFYF